MAGTVYLIQEYNCYVKHPSWWDRFREAVGLIGCADFSTVWASARPLDPDEEDMSRMATKLLGPIPSKQAAQIIDRLKRILEEAGMNVIIEATADD